MSAHTKGPWTASLEDSEILPAPGSKRNTVGRFHAGRGDAGNDARPLRADLVLMAAAPELLELLRKHLDWFDGKFHPGADEASFIAATRAAIKKASP